MAWLRAQQGWTQQQLADRLGVRRNTVARWEVGLEPVPARKQAAVASALGVDGDHLRQQWPARPPLAGLETPALYAAAYEIEGSVDEMLELGPVAGRLASRVHLNRALEFELRQRLPRDSPWELLAAYHLLGAGAELEFWSTHELGCQQFVSHPRLFKDESRLLRHTLRWQPADGATMLLPQVSLVVVEQSRHRRPDFLVL